MPLSFPRLARCTALMIGFISPLNGQASADARTVVVTGEGEAAAAPDQVEFIIGIDVTEAKVETSKTKTDEAMRRILAIAKEFKIDSRDIQSDYMRVQPIQETPYNNSKAGKPVISYNARRDVRILLRDLDKYDGLLAALFNSGANNLHSLQFKSAAMSKLEADARVAAIKDAKSKAEAMASQLGLKLGRAKSVAEGVPDVRPTPMMTMAFEKSLARSDASGPTLAPGEIRVRQLVTVIFEAD